LVAGGTYLFDPAEVPLLLSEMVRFRGGYRFGNDFAAQATEANPTYIIGPSFEYREALAERGLTLVQGSAIRSTYCSRRLKSHRS
jgi:hypothetical protein